MQQQPLSRIIWQRFSAAMRRLFRRLRSIRFRHVAGVMYILRPFAPLLLLLVVGLFLYFMVIDFQRDTQIQSSISNLSERVDIITVETKGLQNTMATLKDGFEKIGGVLRGILDALDVILIPVHAIIDLWNWCPICPGELPDININLPILPDIAASFSGITRLTNAISGFSNDVGALGAALRDFMGRWWRYFQFLVIGLFLWWALNVLSKAYWSIQTGLSMLRGPRAKPPNTPEHRRWRSRPVFETPPILVVDHSLTSVPVVQQSSKRSKQQTTISRQRRVLLSAQAVWPNRHLELFHYALADELTESAWAHFWETLIARGLEKEAVQLVISADIAALQPVVQAFLPNAEIKQAVKTTIMAG